MPLREFECERCGRTFEALIRHPEEEGELSCPACDERRVRRLMSAPAALGGSAEAGGGGGGCGGSGRFT